MLKQLFPTLVELDIIPTVNNHNSFIQYSLYLVNPYILHPLYTYPALSFNIVLFTLTDIISQFTLTYLDDSLLTESLQLIVFR